jgi:hypothetical protein
MGRRTNPALEALHRACSKGPAITEILAFCPVQHATRRDPRLFPIGDGTLNLEGQAKAFRLPDFAAWPDGMPDSFDGLPRVATVLHWGETLGAVYSDGILSIKIAN